MVSDTLKKGPAMPGLFLRESRLESRSYKPFPQHDAGTRV